MIYLPFYGHGLSLNHGTRQLLPKSLYIIAVCM